MELQSGIQHTHAVRLFPGEDLVPKLQEAAHLAMDRTPNCSAAFVITAVGSLCEVTLRMASASKNGSTHENKIKKWDEKLEVVSLVGTFSRDSKHLHMSVADEEGRTFGGHVVGGKVFTTLELIIGTVEGITFERIDDRTTGYKELQVRWYDYE